jgi:hypothetical protein
MEFWSSGVLAFWRFVRKVSISKPQNLKTSKPFKTSKLQNPRTPELQAPPFSGAC